jgi:site-specific recombinase XerD
MGARSISDGFAYVDAAGGRMTFGTWWTQWVATTVDLRASTRARDDNHARRHLLPRYGSTPLGRIDHLAVQAWVSDLSASGLAPATVVKAGQLLGKSLRAAVDAGLLATNPAERVRLPKIERDEMRFLTPDEVVTLADTIDARYPGHGSGRCLRGPPPG